MRVSTFFAATLPLAMAQVRDALGSNAIVLSWRNTRGGVEISASVQAENVTPPHVPQALPRAGTPVAETKPERREDLLSNHFSPKDFLTEPARVHIQPRPVTRGLAALVGRTTAPIPLQAAQQKAHLPRGEEQGRKVAQLAGKSQFETLERSPPIPHPLPDQVEGKGTRQAGLARASSPLTAFLVRAGLTMAQADSFATGSTGELRRALSDSIANALTFDPIAAIPQKPLILVGPPGSGKSTCAAKLAARTIASGHEALLISADSERCGGADQLRALAQRLSARFETVTTLGDLGDLVSEARGRGLVVLIDAPSACPAQPADMRAIARMIAETRLEAVLCLPADLRPDDMDDLAKAYQAIGIKRAIATRLDLTTRRASVLHALKSAKIALAQISATPYISGGVAIASAARVAALLLEPFEDALAEDAA